MSTPKLQAFYKSQKWQKFTAILKQERQNADGDIICEQCGRPIVKRYDMIAHHIIELTDDNVDDVGIALNPDNIQFVHFRCHNEIHERFGSYMRQVYIVWGSPCAGKTTWVNSVARKEDLIMDMDKLWRAIKSDACGEYEKPKALQQNVFALRECMYDMIRTRLGKWHNAYIIGGYPLIAERERLQYAVGADKLIHIDTPREVCEQRASGKSEEWLGYIGDWWARYTPPSEV